MADSKLAASQLAASHSILIVAGEASSSLYALRLLQEFKRRGLNISAFGIGSEDMVAEGFEAIGRSEDLAVVGVQEVVKHLGAIYKVFHGLLDRAKERKPRFALLLDYPDFNMRLMKKLKAQGIPVIYYISPQLWAWRRGRIKQIKEFVDHMLVLFPFEEAFYHDNKVPVTFTGHPLLDEISPQLTNGETSRMMRKRHFINEKAQVLALMPGSRRSEIKHHLKRQLETAEILSERFPYLEIVLLLAPTLKEVDVEYELNRTKTKVRVVQDEPFPMIAMSDVILCASGTATLMVGMMKKPMVVMYRMNELSARVAKILVKSVKHFAMVNLILDRRAVPELFQEDASALNLADQLTPLLDPESERARKMRADLEQVELKLGARGATRRVADHLEQYL